MNTKHLDMLSISKEWLRAKKINIKYSTYIKYKRILEIQLYPLFISQIGVEFDEQKIIEFLTEKKNISKYSISTIQTMKYILSSVYEFAEVKYGMKHIDFKYIKLPKKKSNFEILTKDQERVLCKMCFLKKDFLSIAILFGLFAGLRIGEVAALQWADYDFKNGVITVSKTAQRIENPSKEKSKTCLMITDPKTETSKRKVPVPKFINKIIKEYYHLLENRNENYFILSNSNTPIDPRTIQYGLKRISKNFDSDINFHLLRHTYATRCVEVGIDIKSLSEILGHSNVSITLDKYVHSSLKFKQKQVSKIKSPHFS